MSTQRERTKLFSEAAQVVCELMRSNGVQKVVVQKELSKALSNAFSSTETDGLRDLPPISAMASLNARWHVEERYVDKSGKPRPLTWNGRRGTLLRLAQQVIGTSRARNVVQDLVKRRLVARTNDGKWLPKSLVVKPRGLDRPQVLRTAVMIQRLLRTVSHNSKRHYRGDDLLFEVMTRIPRLPPGEVPAFKRFARKQGMIYVRSVDDWLEARNQRKDASKTKKMREAGVIVFAFEEPTTDP